MAVGTAIGLWMRRNWARQFTIVLWAICMALAVPIVIFAGFNRFGVPGVIFGLVVAIGFPALIVIFLSQPQTRQAVGVTEAGYSARKTLGVVMAMVMMALAGMAFVAYEVLGAIGRGIR